MQTRVVIVGGGTAGWMAAAYLRSTLPGLQSITVIESPGIRTIGVGEATFSTLKLFFDRLGLEERHWMPACGATYKLAIRFENWTREPGHFYHPFQRYEVVQGFNAADWWLKLKRDQPMDRACFTVPAMCEANRSPRFLDGTVFDERVRAYFTPGATPPNNVIAHHTAQYPYGYHFDATLVAEFLKRFATDRGVTHVVDEVGRVELDEQGYIASLHTKSGRVLNGDLFIDCTGFRGLLINQTLAEPFISFHDSLRNDRAVAIPVPWDAQRHGVRPYTTATALSAGWAWTIPLFHRNGCGYVYCSDYLNEEQAEAEFREFLGPAARNAPANHIRMRIGRNRNSWVKNCVAIGLASGFVEPLESTGIFFIQHGLEELVSHFPEGLRANEDQLLSYNKIVGECIDGVREFLTVHYCATDRCDTPYWRDMKRLSLPPALAERMKIYRARLPGPRNVYPHFHGFESYSWSVMLIGMNYAPPRPPTPLMSLDDTEARQMFEHQRRRSRELTETLPSHFEYLTRLHG